MFENKGIEMEMVTLTQICGDLLAKKLLPIPINLWSAGVQILMSMEKCSYCALHGPE